LFNKKKTKTARLNEILFDSMTSLKVSRNENFNQVESFFFNSIQDAIILSQNISVFCLVSLIDLILPSAA